MPMRFKDRSAFLFILIGIKPFILCFPYVWEYIVFDSFHHTDLLATQFHAEVCTMLECFRIQGYFANSKCSIVWTFEIQTIGCRGF